MSTKLKLIILGAFLGSLVFGPPGGVLGAVVAARLYEARRAKETTFEGEHMPPSENP